MTGASDFTKKGVKKKSDLENMVPFGHFFRESRLLYALFGSKKVVFSCFLCRLASYKESS